MDDVIFRLLLGMVNFSIGIIWPLVFFGVIFPRNSEERKNSFMGGVVSVASIIILSAILPLTGHNFHFYWDPFIAGCCIAVSLRALLVSPFLSIAFFMVFTLLITLGVNFEYYWVPFLIGSSIITFLQVAFDPKK